eukprot:939842-Pelagomonas_calceolata.AAC.1
MRSACLRSSQVRGTIYMGERLNALGAKHWDKFASQNYFDQNGVFFSTMVSGPLLLLLFILLVRSNAGDMGACRDLPQPSLFMFAWIVSISALNCAHYSVAKVACQCIG